MAAVRSMLCHMHAIGYVRVSTDRQAEQGVSLEAQEAKIRAMATVQSAALLEVIVDGGESAKSLNRPGLRRLLALINAGKVQTVIVAKLDRLTRSVKDLCGLLELFEKRKVALISIAESLDTGSAAGRLVITIVGAVSQWEREAIGERLAMHCNTSAVRVSAWATSHSAPGSHGMGSIWNRNRVSRLRWRKFSGFAAKARHCADRSGSQHQRAPDAPRYALAAGVHRQDF